MDFGNWYKHSSVFLFHWVEHNRMVWIWRPWSKREAHELHWILYITFDVYHFGRRVHYFCSSCFKLHDFLHKIWVNDFFVVLWKCYVGDSLRLFLESVDVMDFSDQKSYISWCDDGGNFKELHLFGRFSDKSFFKRFGFSPTAKLKQLMKSSSSNISSKQLLM